MSYSDLKYDILEKAEVVDKETWHRHISTFIKHFVVPDKRFRWHHLCVEKPFKASRASYKLYGDLMWNVCSKIDSNTQLELTNRTTKGVFYDFSGEAWWLSPTDAFTVGHGHDSIFSFQEGALAIYFFHEFENIVCGK